jgi:hypothetical protein
MVVTLELSEVSENPALVRRHLEVGDIVKVYDEGRYLFDATDSESVEDDDEDDVDHSNDAYFASEILKTEQLEREGKLKYISLEEHLEWLKQSGEEMKAYVRTQTQRSAS